MDLKNDHTVACDSLCQAKIEELKKQIEDHSFIILELSKHVADLKRHLKVELEPTIVNGRPLQEIAAESSDFELDREYNDGTKFVPQAPGGRDRRKGGIR